LDHNAPYDRRTLRTMNIVKTAKQSVH
jgi:hypothetical protein